MSLSVKRTKIIIPRRRADLLSRQRLLDTLYDLLDNKLVIVSAPAGYGKTSLLVDIAHQHELPFCWYTLDSLDKDLPRFAAHLADSIKRSFPAFGERSLAYIQSMGDDNQDLDRLVTMIVNEAYELVQEHFVIVLDDYHLVHDSQPINDFVSRFVQSINENCHLVVLSRALVPLPDLTLMVARRMVDGLSFQELAFTSAEIQELMFKNYNLVIPTSDAEDLIQATEGWITGLLLSTHGMWQGMADRVRRARASGVEFYDYLAQQVLDQQSPRMRQFLLETSVFDEFNADLCRDVLGKPPEGESWGRLMAAALNHNLFVLPVGEGGSWLRYHPLFRSFLYKQLSDEAHDRLGSLLRILARYWQARQDWDRAYDLYQRLGDHEATAGMLEEAGLSMVHQARYSRIVQWHEALPSGLLRASPILLVRYGLAKAMLGNHEPGLEALNQGIEIFRTWDHHPTRLIGALVWRAHVHFLRANYPASNSDAEEALELAKDIKGRDDLTAEALRVKGINLKRMGQLDQANQKMKQSLDIYRRLMDQPSQARLSLSLGANYMEAGSFGKALDYCRMAIEYYRSKKDYFSLTGAHNDVGYLHHLLGDYLTAGAEYEEAITFFRQSGNLRSGALILMGMGDLYFDLSASDQAMDAYREARQISIRLNDNFFLVYIDLAEAKLARQAGASQLARRLLEDAQKKAAVSGSKYEYGLCLLEDGRQATVAGEFQQAEELLGQASQIFERGGFRLDAGRAYLSLAAAYYSHRQVESAFQALAGALNQARQMESYAPLISAERTLTDLLEAAASHPELGPEAGLLLECYRRFEKDVPGFRRGLRQQQSLAPFAPPRLRLYTLGANRVLLDERPITSADWQTQKTRDLFFLLLSSRNGMLKEVAGEAIWPECSPAQLKLRFKNTLYRIRHALHQEVILFEDGRYEFNRDLDYECDLELFWERLEEARKAANPGHQIRLYQSALELYRGVYLPEVDGAWVEIERERVRQAYERAGLDLARLQWEAGEQDGVLETCHTLLEHEPSQEESHCLIMKVNADRGNRAAVTAQYERCRQALAELGVAVSDKTEKLYKHLIQST
jgi:LuxR family transcriptional regulator, maltose regulon positive regulatory protein